MSTNCINCNEITKKYKCPKCLEPYCSLNCFKEHQKSECKPLTKVPDKSDDDNDPTIFPPFKTEDTVNPAKLELLRTCEPLKQLLYNPHLRSLLQEIDVAQNAWNAMRVAMQEPLFVEFADECLKVIEPPTEDDF
ncbi:zinc finger HIT domain-containing protein 3 [Eupeodes corollae]|uniref:zinc finger HIT domain-containing protein 3 n=1 Tax=Eupeodes corollae TaxID=290404 RepID=UPI002493AE44|nr:zinc finger HIT domain-containing protein 3 [Eupeodes corollae]